MTRLNKIVIAVLGASIPVLIYGYAEGPDAGLAGVPGEANCTYCHSGSSGSGNVKVTFPGGLVYTPGVAQHLVVTVSDSSQRRWGFELTARQANNTNVQAGAFTPGPDGFTQLVCTQTTFQTESFGLSCPSSMPLEYIEHTLRGTQSGVRNSASFQFDWTPPASDVGSVAIYVAGNAANGDNNTTGDHIYLQHYTLSAAPPPTPPPTITSVVNAAGLQPAIAADTWVTIQGTNLATSSRPWSSSEIAGGALPTQLDGVSVTIDGNPAYVSYISPTQINVQSPDDASLGPVSVVVNNNNGSSAPFTVQLQPASPAVYLWSNQYSVSMEANCGVVGASSVFGGVTAPPVQSSGVLTLWGMGLSPTDPTAACGFIGPATLFSNVPTAPAAPGDTVVLWGTGFGPTSPASPAGQLVPAGQVDSVTTSPSVLIGGIPAQVVSAALAPGEAGLYQITVQAPNGLADGDQPVAIQVNGVQSPAGVFITVQNPAPAATQN
jgi:uncharacterized protein (TIGR03437 family)